jgi:hypothetical protein
MAAPALVDPPAGATVAVVAATSLTRHFATSVADGEVRFARTFRELAARHGLGDYVFSVEGARVPHTLLLELLERSESLLSDEAFVFHSLAGWRLGDHGIGDYLNSSALDLSAMLSTIGEFVGLLHDGLGFSLDEDGEGTVLTCDWDEDVVPHRFVSEAVIGKVYTETRRALGGDVGGAMKAVLFAHEAPRYERAYRGLFDVPVEFGQGPRSTGESRARRSSTACGPSRWRSCR